MSTPLRVLIIEDVEQDATLTLRELRRAGYEVTHRRVETPDDLIDALDRESWDVIISDFNLPSFDARAALELVQARRIDIPFIIVSGTVGEDTAVEAMHAGAHDYIVKGNLRRLVPALQRELRDAEQRAARRRADEELLRAEAERKALQLQLLQMDRMVSMGTLAAAVAHEINNPLAFVIANLEHVAERLRETGKTSTTDTLAGIDQIVSETREGAGRVAEIVRSLKTFSRSDDETVAVIDVVRVLDSSVAMAAVELKHRARLVKDYADAPRVRANETRLGQVVLNLVINAAHAVPPGHPDRNEVRVQTQREGDWVLIRVSDTGSGIPPENLERIFEPFFTTKPIGQGTGLGLAICRQIVRELGGDITVRCTVGSGTTFTVRLPAAVEAVEAQRKVSTSPPTVRRGRVLYVDDEPLLGKAMQRLLTRIHDVEVQCSGREALALIERGNRYDAILCDLMMPEMSGMALHAAIHDIAPDQARRMIFLTGGAYAPEARAFLETVANRRLEKPIGRPALLEALQSVIGE